MTISFFGQTFAYLLIHTVYKGCNFEQNQFHLWLHTSFSRLSKKKLKRERFGFRVFGLTQLLGKNERGEVW